MGAAARVAGDLPSCDRLAYRGNSGTIYIQTGPNGNIQWGIYMHNPADGAGPWWVDVYVGRTRVDAKFPPDQDYAPHGSVHPNDAKSGKIFRIEARHTTLDGRGSHSVTNGCVIS